MPANTELAMFPSPKEMRSILTGLPGARPLDLTNTFLRYRNPTDKSMESEVWTLGSGPLLMTWASADRGINVVQVEQGRFAAQYYSVMEVDECPELTYEFYGSNVWMDARGLWHHPEWDRWCVAQVRHHAPDMFALAETTLACRGYVLTGGNIDREDHTIAPRFYGHRIRDYPTMGFCHDGIMSHAARKNHPAHTTPQP